MSGIKFGAILISIFAFYVAPALPLTVLTSMPDLFGPPMAVGERISLFSFGSLASIFLSLVVMWLCGYGHWLPLGLAISRRNSPNANRSFTVS